MKLKQHEQEYETLRQLIMDEWGLSDEDMDDEETENDVNREADNRFYHKFGVEYTDMLYGEEC